MTRIDLNFCGGATGVAGARARNGGSDKGTIIMELGCLGAALGVHSSLDAWAVAHVLARGAVRHCDTL